MGADLPETCKAPHRATASHPTAIPFYISDSAGVTPSTMSFVPTVWRAEGPAFARSSMDMDAPSFHLQIQPPVLAQPKYPKAVGEMPACPTSEQRKVHERHSCLLLENSATFMFSDLSYPNSQETQSSLLLVGKRHQLLIKGSYRNNLFRRRRISRFEAHQKRTPEPLAFGKALRGRHCHLASTREKGLGKTATSPYRQPNGA